jgi:hypothetical protein
MQSKTQRRICFFIFAALFILLIPVSVLFADGYRFNAHWRLVATGSIALSDVPDDAGVYLNYQPKHSSAFLTNTYYMNDLVPGDYFVVVAKAGYWSWAKHVTVTARNVVTFSVLLLPKDPTLLAILPTVAPSDSPSGLGGSLFAFFSTTTDVVAQSNPQYQQVAKLFATSTNQGAVIIKNQREIWYQGDQVFAQWLGDPALMPRSFSAPFIYTSPQPILGLDFFPNRDDVLLVLTSEGLYAVETDHHVPQNIEPYYLAPHIDFRVFNDDQIYIEKSGDFYQVEP